MGKEIPHCPQNLDQGIHPPPNLLVPRRCPLLRRLLVILLFFFLSPFLSLVVPICPLHRLLTLRTFWVDASHDILLIVLVVVLLFHFSPSTVLLVSPSRRLDLAFLSFLLLLLLDVAMLLSPFFLL